ncbi:MAG: 1-acyl-sn-glycerol-3-phosphate acyltransferase [Caldilineales bacterium]|nr:1-acyl-sn-glycerol-3-phosphate acyltransferase [Caldilineales bacterium]
MIRSNRRLWRILALVLGLIAALLWARKRLQPTGPDSARLATVHQALTVEIVKAFGFTPGGWASRLAGVIFWLPAQASARLVVAVDTQVEEMGLAAACRSLLSRFVDETVVRGKEFLPASGPLLIASNHPGAYDVPLILASLPRDDVKVFSSTLPFLDALPHVSSHAIQLTRDPHDAMTALRAGVQHLRAGGALVILPTGVVDPDPALLPGAGAALQNWSRSVALLLRQVPETRLIVTIVSGVLSPTWLHSPIVRVQKEVWRQHKLAEFLQVIQQLLLPGSLTLSPRLSFAPPLTVGELTAAGSDLHAQIIANAQSLLREHMSAL